jgi:hypothetical protein
MIGFLTLFETGVALRTFARQWSLSQDKSLVDVGGWAYSGSDSMGVCPIGKEIRSLR